MYWGRLLVEHVCQFVTDHMYQLHIPVSKWDREANWPYGPNFRLLIKLILENCVFLYKIFKVVLTALYSK